MNLSSHIDELKKKHTNLSEVVDKAQRAPASDAMRISNLKKQKLRLKEEISRLSTSS